MAMKKELCPGCGKAGHSVMPITVQSLVKAEKKRLLERLDGFYFCGEKECEVVYYNPQTGQTVLVGDMTVPVFQKSNDPNRLVCYCFKHSVSALVNDYLKHGRSLLLDDIKDKCSKGLAHCEETNPQGSCCLGNIQKLLNSVSQQAGVDPAKCSCCCSPKNDPGNKKLSGGSNCC